MSSGRMPCPMGVNCKTSVEVASGTSPTGSNSMASKASPRMEGGMQRRSVMSKRILVATGEAHGPMPR